MELDKHTPTFEEGGGDEFLLSQLQYNPYKDEMATLKEEVAEAFERFWNKDQVCGFNNKGERIGTGIPRVKPTYNNNEYSL